MNENEKSRIIAGTMIRQEQSIGASDPRDNDTADSAFLQGQIAPILCRGEEYAQTAKELATVLGLPDTRLVTRQIERERLSGVPICASCKGYFLPETADEMRRYVRHFESRQSHIRKTATALQYALAVLEMQETFDGGV